MLMIMSVSVITLLMRVAMLLMLLTVMATLMTTMMTMMMMMLGLVIVAMLLLMLMLTMLMLMSFFLADYYVCCSVAGSLCGRATSWMQPLVRPTLEELGVHCVSWSMLRIAASRLLCSRFAL